MSGKTYDKDYASPKEVVEQLLARGLIIPDPAKAEEDVRKMGYARLRIYMETRCDGQRQFSGDVTFEQIVELHEFDSILRATCFEPVGMVEILFRNEIAEVLSEAHGSHPHEVEAVFASKKEYEDTRTEFIDRYEKVRDNNPNSLARQYSNEFSEPYLPPIWYMKEMLTFNEIIKLFNRLIPEFRKTVSKPFGITDPERLVNWMYSFNELRNVCAHHERLFNRVFYNAPGEIRVMDASGGSINSKIPNDGVSRDKLAGVLNSLDYAMSNKFRSMNVEKRVKNIVQESDGIIKLTEIGYS